MKERYVVVAWDRSTGESYISHEMLKSAYDLETAMSVLDGLSTTMGAERHFFLVPYSQVHVFLNLDGERQTNVSRRENTRITH